MEWGCCNSLIKMYIGFFVCLGVLGMTNTYRSMRRYLRNNTAKVRRYKNRSFRHLEKITLRKFGYILKKSKDRGF